MPPSTGSAPKIARAISVRPLPTSPASPTISPARDGRSETSCRTPGRRRPVDRQHDGRVRRRRRGGGKSARRARPEHRRSRGVASVSAAAGRRPDEAPVAQDGDVVGRARAPRRGSARRRRSSSRRRAGRADHRSRRSASSRVSAAVGSSMTISSRVARERAEDLDLLLVGDAQRARRGRRRATVEADRAGELVEAARACAPRSTKPRRAAARRRGTRSRAPSGPARAPAPGR